MNDGTVPNLGGSVSSAELPNLGLVTVRSEFGGVSYGSGLVRPNAKNRGSLLVFIHRITKSNILLALQKYGPVVS